MNISMLVGVILFGLAGTVCGTVAIGMFNEKEYALGIAIIPITLTWYWMIALTFTGHLQWW